MSRSPLSSLSVLGAAWLLVAACSNASAPSSPGPAAAGQGATVQANGVDGTAHTHAAAPAEDNGYIPGWFDGDDVQLHYTKSYACDAPPTSQAPTGCEIGAPAG